MVGEEGELGKVGEGFDVFEVGAFCGGVREEGFGGDAGIEEVCIESGESLLPVAGVGEVAGASEAFEPVVGDVFCGGFTTGEHEDVIAGCGTGEDVGIGLGNVAGLEFACCDGV